MNQAQPIPYTIEASSPERYPRGWFCIGASHEFSTDKPKQMDYFGSSLVAYRSESGEINVLDAYCPHMGANLASGHVQGGSIVCPFHAWSWGADGICDGIPYAKKIPPKAVIKAWPVRELNELIYLWHDPDGGEPISEQEIPVDAVVSEPGWSPWIIHRVEVGVHARELIDNMADKAHFGPVHLISTVNHFSNVSEGHKYTQYMKSKGDWGEMDSEATYHGPGYMLHHVSTTDPQGQINSRSMTLVMNVPTGPDSFEFIAGFKYPLPEGVVSQDEVKEFCDQTLETLKHVPGGLFSDLAIWQNKCAIDNPVLCDGDGPVTRLRQWYEQFLVPLGDVSASLKERKVYDKSELLEWTELPQKNSRFS